MTSSERSIDPPARWANDTLEAGTLVNGYELVAPVGGRGRGARVYKARSSSRGTVVAVKAFRSSGASRESVVREFHLLRHLRSPHIVGALDSGICENVGPYLVMEYLDGERLDRWCRGAPRLGFARATLIARDLLLGLMHMHPNRDLCLQHGYVHGDINPGNVVIASGRAVLIDFSNATRADTMSSPRGYTPLDYTSRSLATDLDLYQVGVTVLEALVGARLDKADPSGAGRLRQAALHASAGSSLLRVLLGLTEPRAAARYRSAGEALADLMRGPFDVAGGADP